MANRFCRRPDGTTSGIIHDHIVNFNYDILGNATDQWAFIADTDYELVGARMIPTVAGTDGSAVSADVKKASGTTAVASGTTMLASTFDLKATINTLQTATLSATTANRRVTSGDRIGVDFTGVLTSATGMIQLNLKRIQSGNSDK
jgi:hypothetical protein